MTSFTEWSRHIRQKEELNRDEEEEEDLEGDEDRLGATVVYSAQGPATLGPDVWGQKRWALQAIKVHAVSCYLRNRYLDVWKPERLGTGQSKGKILTATKIWQYY